MAEPARADDMPVGERRSVEAGEGFTRADTNGFRLLEGLLVPADGCHLATDVYLPRKVGAGRPVVGTAACVLIRTPYGRRAHLAEGVAWARRGHACVVQDVRGRHGSTGTWQPWRWEMLDAHAVCEWLKRQPWSDGTFVATGASYAAHTAWACALAAPDHVRGVLSAVAALGPRQVKLDPSGVLRLAEHVAWWVEHGDASSSRPGLATALRTARPDLLNHLPVTDLATEFPVDLPGWTEMLDALCPPRSGDQHPDLHPTISPEPSTDLLGVDEVALVRVPSLHVGGWSDLLVQDTFRHFAAAGADHPHRPARGLIVGPWGHHLNSAAPVGRTAQPLGVIEVSWIESLLRGHTPPGDVVHVWDLAQQAWCDYTGSDAAVQQVTLHAGTARTLSAADPTSAPGSTSPPGSTTSAGSTRPPEVIVAEFVHDPEDPRPFTATGEVRPPVVSRADAVYFLSQPVRAVARLRGQVTATVRLQADAHESDVILRLLHLRDERTIVVARGMTRYHSPTPMRWHTVQVDLGQTVVSVQPGDVLVLEVTGGDHPHVARHLGTAQDRYRSSTTRRVLYRLASGVQHPTTVHLSLEASSGAPATHPWGAFPLPVSLKRSYLIGG